MYLVSPKGSLTCREKPVSRQEQLRGNLHLGLRVVVLESRKIPFVLLVIHSFSGAVVSCREGREGEVEKEGLGWLQTSVWPLPGDLTWIP